LIKETIALNPVDKVVEFGTVLNHKTSRGDVVRYSKVMNMRATAYTASYADTGKSHGDPGFGVTYTGVKVRKGIIAVDPKVIPLGTRVYVEVAGSTPDYGYAVAADIGSAIKGDLIDLYFDGQATVNRWGCKRVKVYILDDE
jgi:3D (Asp-Asp-Asp) domain-containing protein